MRVYASDQAHSGAEKAMIVLGLGEENVVRVRSDERFRMDVQALERAIADDVARGMRPMAVVATVGTTSTASIDPVTEIAAVCRAHGRVAARRCGVRWRARDAAGAARGDGGRGARGLGSRERAQVAVHPARLQRAVHEAARACCAQCSRSRRSICAAMPERMAS